MNKKELAQKRTYWKEIINEFEQSPLNQTKFAQEKGLNDHQISYWRRKFKKDKNNKVSVSPFLKVKAKDPILKNKNQGIKIDPIWLASFLKELYEGT